MQVIRNNSKQIKIVSFTAIIIMTLSFAVYPQSYTKYKVEKDEVLKYSSNIVSLKKDNNGPMTLKSVTNKEAILEFSLPKNSTDLGYVESDVYKLNLPEGCSTQNETITFTDTDNLNIELTCDLTYENLLKTEEDKKYLDINVEVNEVVNNEIPFRYKEYTYHEEYSVEENTVKEEEPAQESNYNITDFQTSLINSLITKDKYKSYQKEISSYIESADLTNNTFNLLGISVSYDEEFNQYLYKLDENFLGYACTYYENTINQATSDTTMIFSTEERTDIESIFEYYLKEYSSFSNDDYYLILNYIKSKNGISSLILDKINIEGISALSENKITIANNIIDYASNLIEADNFKLYYLNNENSKNIFLTALNSLREIPQELKNEIFTRDDIINAAIQDYNPDQTESYFIIRTVEGQFLIWLLQTEEYNIINITKFITLDKEETIDFTLSYNNQKPTQEQLKSIISYLTLQYKGEFIEESLNEIDEDDKTTITFAIKKEIEQPPKEEESSNNSQNQDSQEKKQPDPTPDLPNENTPTSNITSSED